MRLQIGTEADYLRAHLTVIVDGSRSRNSAMRDLKQRVTSVLERWREQWREKWRAAATEGLRATPEGIRSRARKGRSS